MGGAAEIPAELMDFSASGAVLHALTPPPTLPPMPASPAILEVPSAPSAPAVPPAHAVAAGRATPPPPLVPPIGPMPAEPAVPMPGAAPEEALASQDGGPKEDQDLPEGPIGEGCPAQMLADAAGDFPKHSAEEEALLRLDGGPKEDLPEGPIGEGGPAQMLADAACSFPKDSPMAADCSTGEGRRAQMQVDTDDFPKGSAEGEALPSLEGAPETKSHLLEVSTEEVGRVCAVGPLHENLPGNFLLEAAVAPNERTLEEGLQGDSTVAQLGASGLNDTQVEMADREDQQASTATAAGLPDHDAHAAGSQAADGPVVEEVARPVIEASGGAAQQNRDDGYLAPGKRPPRPTKGMAYTAFRPREPYVTLLGQTGSGKSSAANQLCAQDPFAALFAVGTSFGAETRAIQVQWSHTLGRNVTDTPPSYQAGLSRAERLEAAHEVMSQVSEHLSEVGGWLIWTIEGSRVTKQIRALAETLAILYPSWPCHTMVLSRTSNPVLLQECMDEVSATRPRLTLQERMQLACDMHDERQLERMNNSLAVYGANRIAENRLPAFTTYVVDTDWFNGARLVDRLSSFMQGQEALRPGAVLKWGEILEAVRARGRDEFLQAQRVHGMRVEALTMQIRDLKGRMLAFTTVVPTTMAGIWLGLQIAWTGAVSPTWHAVRTKAVPPLVADLVVVSVVAIIEIQERLSVLEPELAQLEATRQDEKVAFFRSVKERLDHIDSLIAEEM